MLLNPRTWTVAHKLTAAVLLFVLAPLGAVAWLNVQASKDAVEQRERAALETLARSGAQLLSERIDAARRVARLVAHDPVLIEALVTASSAGEIVAEPLQVHRQLLNAARSDPSFEHVYVLDDRGRCIGSSLSADRPRLIGQDFSNRPYFTAVARDGKPSFVTDVLKSKNTPGTAVYFSAAVTAGQGQQPPRGVAVVKLSGAALHSLVETLSIRGESDETHERVRAWLLDREGIVVSESVGGQQQPFGSETGFAGWATHTLDAQTVARLTLAERFKGVDANGQSVDYLTGIDERVLPFPPADTVAAHTTRFVLPPDTAVIAGVAPVQLEPTMSENYGRIVIVQAKSAYERPMEGLGQRARNSLALGALFVGGALLILVRGLSRRINEIADATKAAAGGDLNVTVPAEQQDELGALARAFNGMTGQLSVAMEVAESRRVEAERQKSFVAKAFGRFVSPQLVERLLAEPDALALGGHRQEVTILMSDLRGFSSYSDRLEPEEVVELLNIFLRKMTDVIAGYDGTIDEIIGDALLVIFGAPVADEAHAERAVACALAMQLAMVDVNDELREARLPRIQMGIGINTGDVVVGNIGSEARLKYAVVGRNVNLTARIESCTVGGQVLVADSTVQAAGDHVRTEGSFEMWPKGATARLRVHDVSGIGGKHALQLDRSADTDASLPHPIPIRFGVLDGVSVPELELPGSIVRLSPNGATIQTSTEPRIMSTLKIQLMRDETTPAPGEIYGKVMAYAPIEREARVRFSSISPQLEDLVVGLLATLPSAK